MVNSNFIYEFFLKKKGKKEIYNLFIWKWIGSSQENYGGVNAFKSRQTEHGGSLKAALTHLLPNLRRNRPIQISNIQIQPFDTKEKIQIKKAKLKKREPTCIPFSLNGSIEQYIDILKNGTRERNKQVTSCTYFIFHTLFFIIF